MAQNIDEYLTESKSKGQKLVEFATIALIRKFKSYSKLVSSDCRLSVVGKNRESAVAENFIKNIRYMDSICNSENVRFISILQPVNGIGSKELTGPEEHFKDILMQRKTNWGKSVLEFDKDYYSEVRAGGKYLPYFYDFSDVFDDYDGQIFVDTVHFSDVGQKKVASEISRLILEEDND